MSSTNLSAALAPRIAPPHFDTAAHRARCLAQLRSKPSGLEQYIYMSALKARDPDLFYAVLLENLLEIIPILYTPTVGDACQNYSHIWRRPEGLYVSIDHKGQIRERLETWSRTEEARIAVVTDGSRILGLGDLGANGLPISIGKLDLYIAGAGIKPNSTVPICLDLGTNTEKYLTDPLYLGVRRTRPGNEEMDAFMEEFMEAMEDVFPALTVQFEDFSTDNAFRYLDLFRDRYRVFNDDIQGTGAVVLAGFLNAARLASKASGLPLQEHRILFFGAGSAGVGVAKQLQSFFTLQGMSEEEARKQIYTVDSKGLIVAGRKGLQEHKKHFARTDYDGPALTSLLDVIDYVKPTALLGLSTVKGAFTEEVVRKISALNARPIIFPLSNPVKLCEVDYEDAIRWSDGKVIFASGSPYEHVTYKGKMYEAGQGNNFYVFPGIGLGTTLAKAQHVSDAMIEAAAIACSTALNAEETAADLVYPRIARIRDISAKIALDVIRKAQAEGLDDNAYLRLLNDEALMVRIKEKMWIPRQLGPHPHTHLLKAVDYTNGAYVNGVNGTNGHAHGVTNGGSRL